MREITNYGIGEMDGRFPVLRVSRDGGPRICFEVEVPPFASLSRNDFWGTLRVDRMEAAAESVSRSVSFLD